MHRPLPDDTTQARWLVGVNSDSSDIPAYSLVKVASTDAQGRFNVAQPDTDGEAVYVVGDLAIPAADADGDGVGAITCDWPAWAKYDDADGTPAIGETWGAESGTFKLKKSQPGFRIASNADTDRKIVRVERSGGGCEGTVCTDYYTANNGNFTAQFSMSNGGESLVWQTMTELPVETAVLVKGAILAGVDVAGTGHTTRVQGRLVAVEVGGGVVASLSAWVPLGYYSDNGGAFWTSDPPMAGFTTASFGRQGVAARRYTVAQATYDAYGTIYVAWQLKLITSKAGSLSVSIDGIGNLTHITTATGCGTCNPVEPEEP